MHREKAVDAGRGSLMHLRSAIGPDPIEEDTESRWCFGMVRTRVVAETGGVGEQQRRHCGRLTNRAAPSGNHDQCAVRHEARLGQRARFVA